MPVKGLEAENVPRVIGKGGGVMAEGLFLETVPRMFPDPLEGSTRDHVAAPDLLVPPALGEFGQCPVIDSVGHAVADEVNPQGLGVLGWGLGCHQHDGGEKNGVADHGVGSGIVAVDSAGNCSRRRQDPQHPVATTQAFPRPAAYRSAPNVRR